MVFGIIVGAYSSNFLAPALFMWISKEKNGDKKHATVVAEVKKEEIPKATQEEAEVEIPSAERKLKGKRQQKK